MVVAERYQWAYGFASFVTTAAYAVWLVVQLQDHAPQDVNYVPALLWTLGASFVIHSVGRGLASHACRRAELESDERDREIARHTSAASFFVFSALAAVPLVLGMLGADAFWLTNVLFFAFALTAIFGVLCTAYLYRRGVTA